MSTNATTTIDAYFATAQTARRAIHELQILGIAVSDPTPVAPVDGRPWMLVVIADTGAMSSRYPKATLVDKVASIVGKFDGVTQHSG